MPLDQVDVDQMEDSEDGGEMSFFDHLEILRWHLIRSIGAITIVSLVLFFFKNFVFDYAIGGPLRKDFPTYQLLCNISEKIGWDKLCLSPPDLVLQNLGFGEAFFLHIKVTLILGFIVAFPYVVYELWKFVKPGLRRGEVKSIRWLVLVCSVLFFLGTSFGYFVVAPFAVNFLAFYEVPIAVNNPQTSSYIFYMLMFILPCGIGFQLPIVVHFMARYGLVTPADMRKYRKHAFIVILLLAAVLTPPDVISQLLIGIPIYGLYEMSIYVAKAANKQYEKDME